MADFSELLKYKPSRCDDGILNTCKTGKEIETATFLDCSWKQIVLLPECLQNVVGLVEINLSKNQLSYLPTYMSLMTKLKTIFLDENTLTSLPDVLSYLTNLEVLRANQNQIVAMPEWIGELTNLQTFHIVKNKLSALPITISQLTNLAHLNLHSNNIPEGIGMLTNIRRLILGCSRELRGNSVGPGNQISSLPYSLFNLKKLEVLDLQELPLEPVIKSVSEHGISHILEHLRKGLLHTKNLYQSRVLLLGEPGSGKTTLMKSIILKSTNFVSPCAAQMPTTLDIDIHPDPYVVKVGRSNVSLTMWDFSGSAKFECLGQLFVSTGAVIILVWNMSDRSDHSSLKRWANVVATAAPGARVIVVGTNYDQCSTLSEQDKEAMVDSIKQLLAPLRSVIKFVDFITVSNLNGHNIPVLREKITQLVSQLPSLNIEYPESFFKMMQVIDAVVRSKANATMTTKEFESYMTMFRSDLNAHTALTVLRDIGSVVWVNKPDFSEKVICHPAFLIRIFRIIFKTPHIRGVSGVYVSHHFRGVLDENFPGLADEVLEIMHFYHLSFPSSDGNFEIIPYLLNEAAPHPEMWPWSPSAAVPAFINCEIRFNMLPRFAFQTLIGSLGPQRFKGGKEGPGRDFFSTNYIVSTICALKKAQTQPTYQFMLYHHKDERRVFVSVRVINEKYPALDCMKHLMDIITKKLERYESYTMEHKLIICPFCSQRQPAFECCGRISMDQVDVDEEGRITCLKEQERYTLEEWTEGKVISTSKYTLAADALFVPDLLSIERCAEDYASQGAASPLASPRNTFSSVSSSPLASPTKSLSTSTSSNIATSYASSPKPQRAILSASLSTSSMSAASPSVPSPLSLSTSLTGAPPPPSSFSDTALLFQIHCESFGEAHRVDGLSLYITAQQILSNRKILHYFLKLWKPQANLSALTADSEGIEAAEMVQWFGKRGASSGVHRHHRTQEYAKVVDALDPTGQWRNHLQAKQFQDGTVRLLCPQCYAMIDESSLFLSSPSLAPALASSQSDQRAMTGIMLYRHTAFYKSWERRFFVLDKDARVLIRYLDGTMRVSSGTIPIEGDFQVSEWETGDEMFGLMLKFPKKQYQFKTKTEPERDAWLVHLSGMKVTSS